MLIHWKGRKVQGLGPLVWQYRFCLAAVLLFLLPFCAEAGEPDAGAPGMSLSDCVKQALAQNPATQSAGAAVMSAGEAESAAKAPYYPNLFFNTGYSYWQRRLFLPPGVGIPGRVPPVLGPFNDFTLSLNTSYTLFDFGERKAQSGSAKAGLELTLAQQEGTREDVALSVHEAYYDLAAALQNRDVAAESLKRAEDHVKLAKDRKEVGAAPLADVLRSEVEAANAKLSVVRADNQVRLASGSLNTAMGQPAEKPLGVSTVLEEVTPPDVDLTSELDRAVQGRSAVEIARQRVEQSRQSVDAEHSAFYPRISFVGAYGREDDVFFPNENTWTVGVNLSLPIFTGFSTQHSVARARADLAQSQANLQQTILSVRQQTWNIYSELQEAYEAVQASQALVNTATESLRYARERYEVGAGTITDLLDAETSLAQAQASRVNAEKDFHKAKARFRWSIGKLLS